MRYEDFLPLGLNTNEAKVYYALIRKGRATASELIKELAVHRNIVYDNLEKLTEKGLVSFVLQERKRFYQAQEPDSIVSMLEERKQAIDTKIAHARALVPQISEVFATQGEHSYADVYKGVKGVKKVLSKIVSGEFNEVFVIGVSNESVEVMSVPFWDNYNQKVRASGQKEFILMNNEYQDTTIMTKNPHNQVRVLPPELSQKVELMMYGEYVSIFVYEATPTVLVIKDTNIFKTFKAQFDFLWALSKPLRNK